jgi:hypothetical protein
MRKISGSICIHLVYLTSQTQHGGSYGMDSAWWELRQEEPKNVLAVVSYGDGWKAPPHLPEPKYPETTKASYATAVKAWRTNTSREYHVSKCGRMQSWEIRISGPPSRPLCSKFTQSHAIRAVVMKLEAAQMEPSIRKRRVSVVCQCNSCIASAVGDR